ncbi:hypothetical protein LTR36_000726 [Oleoguttula mirabilis]|uniref:DAGKc domain-containing protein n=1 Tax=Oleoguttula mirabilis TaxID=1507867 RepID=A0AAV9JRD1_9PEZI|nr:hypothetical protein LTR36_000726 [Oleoguttula mirabilis]
MPIHARVPDDYSVLYIDSTTDVKHNKASIPGVFKSFVATKLPQQFVHDYQPPGNACWQTRQDRADGYPNLHIVVSTGSGTGQAQAVWEQMLRPMLQHVCSLETKDYALHFTTSEYTVTDLTRDTFLTQANRGVTQAIILLSGDGGMVDVVNALKSGQQSRSYVKPSVALLPLGTGNALANSAGIIGDNTMGLKTLLQGSQKELPLFCATFSPGARLLVNEGRDERPLHTVDGTPLAHGAVVCSWGLHASLVANSDSAEYRKFGAERFGMAAKDLLFPANGSSPHPYKGKVSVLRPSTNAKDDWQPINRGAHGYVLVTLVSQLEKGFTISPASRPLDGKLRLVHFGPVIGDEAMDIMKKAYDGGKHATDERVGYEEIEGVRIHFEEEEERWRKVCVDGKIVRVEKGGWVEVRAGVKGVLDLIVRQ